MERKSWKGPVVMLVIAVVALALASAPWGEEPVAAEEERGGFLFPVTVAPVEIGEVVESVELVGDVVTNRRAELAFERAGRVIEVSADLGDQIERGAVLARLEDEVLERQLEVARARAEAQRAEAAHARREADRAREVGGDLLAESVSDRRVATAEVEIARTAEAEAEIERLSAVLRQGELRAPFDAVVTRRLVTLGSYAAAGAMAFEVVDLERREVHAEVPATVAAALAPGTPVTLRVDEEPGFRLDARLSQLVPAADPATRTFRGVIRLAELDAERRLLPGMFVRATFERRRVEDVPRVPVDAVLTTDAGTVVVLAETSSDDTPLTARMQPVRVLARDGRHAAIASLDGAPLEDGLLVVVTGADNVFPGAPLAPKPHGGGVGDGAPSTTKAP